MDAEPTARVVVGFDLSPESRQAVWWAADEAASQESPLLLVHAHTVPLEEWSHIRLAVESAALDPNSEVGIEITTLLDECRRTHPTLDAAATLRWGHPAKVLANVAGPADVLVLGPAQQSRFRRVLLGSTAAELIRSASARVVVRQHRTPEPNDEAAPAGRHIVVGVDGSDTSVRALGFAREFASRRGADVIALIAWDTETLDATVPGAGRDLEGAEVTGLCQRIVDNALSQREEQHTEVPVRGEVVAAQAPTDALLSSSQGAELLVVGTRGLGGVRGTLLGSVSRAVADRASCPVAIVR